MYLLPREHPATKKILDSSSTVNCDIYADHVTDTNKQLIDEFIRFIETHLNKLKKVHCQRTTRVSTRQQTGRDGQLNSHSQMKKHAILQLWISWAVFFCFILFFFMLLLLILLADAAIKIIFPKRELHTAWVEAVFSCSAVLHNFNCVFVSVEMIFWILIYAHAVETVCVLFLLNNSDGNESITQNK